MSITSQSICEIKVIPHIHTEHLAYTCHTVTRVCINAHFHAGQISIQSCHIHIHITLTRYSHAHHTHIPYTIHSDHIDTTHTIKPCTETH